MTTERIEIKLSGATFIFTFCFVEEKTNTKPAEIKMEVDVVRNRYRPNVVRTWSDGHIGMNKKKP
jgi:hypothetical protein